MRPIPFYGRTVGRNEICLLILRRAKRNYWTGCSFDFRRS